MPETQEDPMAIASVEMKLIAEDYTPTSVEKFDVRAALSADYAEEVVNREP